MILPEINAPEINDVVGWIYNHATRNLWRVAGWYDLEDLINDGLLIALKCRVKLGTDIDDKQFGAYVRRAFHNHLGELIRKKRSLNEVRLLDLAELMKRGDLSEKECEERLVPPQAQRQEMETALYRLPEGLRRVLDLMLNEDGRKKLDEPMRQRLDGVETMADRLYRLAGWRRDLDFEEELTEYLLMG